MPPYDDILPALLPSLRRGMPIQEVKHIAKEVAANVRHIHALIDLLQYPESCTRIQSRKAAWILHHAFQMDERGFLPLRKTFWKVLDAVEDESVLRELLKILASPIWADAESESQRKELLELGLHYLFVPNASLATHYAAMQIIQSRAQNQAEYAAALEALKELRSAIGKTHLPLSRCIQRYEKRFLQKLARTKSPN